MSRKIIISLNEIKKIIEHAVEEELNNTSEKEMLPVEVEPEIKLVKVCSGQDVPFGSKEHVDDLSRTLMGLENVKMQFWDRGSTSKYLVSNTCARLKKLIQRLSSKLETTK